MEQNLPEKTGNTLAQWKTILTSKQLNKHSDIMAFLKKECGITHGYANFIALKFRESDAGSTSPDELIEAQYAKKQALRPVFEGLRQAILAFGSDVEEAPKKAAVSYRRKRQFALLKPATTSRMDIGLKFTDRAVGGRLLDSGPFGTMCTHRITANADDPIDDVLLELLHDAYQDAG
ncbi:DUF5655 domain-containing protein [Alteromonas halophila]|uniref:DUF5655 domain-containing protein n=1 Tax=Alteromonas halophila TaxID=516698 RepID=A0A918JN40_9ALTE|nr:DUF5655 domain-containing protein [Alteromonas halophila]GGW87243.1 hypothetical protein GCM10007391_21400 [Alteromonas halophila]